MKIKVLNLVLSILLFNTISMNMFAQTSYIKDRWSVSASHARCKTTKVRPNLVTHELSAEKKSNFRLQVNYGISRFLESNLYLGYSVFEAIPIINNNTTIVNGVSYYGGNSIVKSPTPYYGIGCNFHLLPLFINSKDFRFDLYVTGQLGGHYFSKKVSQGYKPAIKGHQIEYGIGPGVSFYIFKHLGVYTEYKIGKYYFETNNYLRYGLTYKF